MTKPRTAPYNIFDPKKSKYALQHENEYKSKENSGFPKYLQHRENETFEPTELQNPEDVKIQARELREKLKI